MADLGGYFDTLDATWPAGEKITLGPLTLRRSNGGGKRVRAATASGPVGADDVAVAEARMRDLDQPPLFQIRPGDDVLDQLLESQGYGVVDPVAALTFDVPLGDPKPVERLSTDLYVPPPPPGPDHRPRNSALLAGAAVLLVAAVAVAVVGMRRRLR